MDKKGRHFHFVGITQTEEEANKLCAELNEQGYAPYTSQRSDNKLFEVFTRFSDAEECQWILERQHCDACTPEKKSKCSTKLCTVKRDLDDILWKESHGFHELLRYRLKTLRSGNN